MRFIIDDLILDGTRDEWNYELFVEETDDALTDAEWDIIRDLQIEALKEVIREKDSALQIIPLIKRKHREILIGSTVTSLSLWLFIAYLAREKDAPVSSSTVAPAVQSVPDEAQKILEQIQDLLDQSSHKINIREL